MIESREKRSFEIGICGNCQFGRTIRSQKGSTFILCERSFADEHFVKYPTIPLSECDGFRALPPSTS